MRKLLPLLLLIAVFTTSCREKWNESTKNQFYEGCTEEANHWAATHEIAKTYCDCVLEKMMAKYPHQEDAFEHLDSLAKDPDLIRCKEEVLNKAK